MPPKKKLPLPAANQPQLKTFFWSESPKQDTESIEDSTTAKIDQTTTSAAKVKEYRRTFQCNWSKIWPWLEYDKESGVMRCKLCVENKKNNSFTVGCAIFKTTSMHRHEESSDHKSCVSAPALACEFQQKMAAVNSARDLAVLKCIDTVIWLVYENVPLSKFEKIFPLLKELEVPGLEPLQINSRTQYSSYYTSLEFLEAISDVIDNDVNIKIMKSPFITILADESTDLAHKKRMTLNARIVDPETSKPETIFLSDIEYCDGTGFGLAEVIFQEMSKRNISTSKLIGFGSDGASVMTGGDKGVRGALLRKQPHLIHVHCMAHRLALCTSQAADSVPMIQNFQQWLTNLFYYFDQSSTREQELHSIQAILQSPILKYKEIHAVRWLSVLQAVDAVYRTLDPLLTYLHQREAAKDPKSKGLLKHFATVEFIYIVYLLMDILALVSKLCLTFQKENLDVASAKLAVDQCLADLEAYNDGRQFFPTHLEHFDRDVVIEDGHHVFKGHHLTYKQTNLAGLKNLFLNALLGNIKKRFPQKSLVDAFFVLGMRTINMEGEDTAAYFGNLEMDQIMAHFGESKEHKGNVSQPLFDKTIVMVQWRRAKNIVRSMKYPVDKFVDLWQVLTQFHSDELSEVIKLAQICMILPLHTADCERTFSQQNKILTKCRAKLSTVQLDRLLRVRLFLKAGGTIDKQKALQRWKASKDRKLYAVKL